MKDCHCGGNNSLRPSIGGIRCECGGMLTQAQINHRIADRLCEIEEEQFKMISALQVLGADLCDVCDEWAKDCWCDGDDCICPKCLEYNQGRPFGNEHLEEEEYYRKAKSLARYLSSRGMKINNREVSKAYELISL